MVAGNLYKFCLVGKRAFSSDLVVNIREQPHEIVYIFRKSMVHLKKIRELGIPYGKFYAETVVGKYNEDVIVIQRFDARFLKKNRKNSFGRTPVYEFRVPKQHALFEGKPEFDTDENYGFISGWLEQARRYWGGEYRIRIFNNRLGVFESDEKTP